MPYGILGRHKVHGQIFQGTTKLKCIWTKYTNTEIMKITSASEIYETV